MVDKLSTLSAASIWTSAYADQSAELSAVASASDSADISYFSQSNLDSSSSSQVILSSAAQDSARSDAYASAVSNNTEDVQRAASMTVGYVAWLVDVLGIGPPPLASAVLQTIINKASAANTGIDPPISDVISRAQATHNATALMVRNLDLSFQNGKVTSASVESVTLGVITSQMSASIASANLPVVLDISGTGAMASTTNSSALQTQSSRPLMIIHEGGQVQSDGSARLRLDTLLPID